MKKDTKYSMLIGVAVCVLIGGGIFGYIQIFTEGLDRLPVKVCNGAVSREIVAGVLPDARSAEDGSGVVGAGADFFLSCHVNTSGNSILSGESEISDASLQTWIDHYKRGEVPNLVSGGRAKAFSTSDLATVYIPCTPQGVKASDAAQAYALTTEARVIGKSRVHGAELRQALTDFAYELTRYAYKAGKCQNHLALPSELPRYKSTHG